MGTKKTRQAPSYHFQSILQCKCSTVQCKTGRSILKKKTKSKNTCKQPPWQWHLWFAVPLLSFSWHSILCAGLYRWQSTQVLFASPLLVPGIIHYLRNPKYFQSCQFTGCDSTLRGLKEQGLSQVFMVLSRSQQPC